MSLGRDESKHIACDFKGHEDDCPKQCARCGISIKTDGDLALAQSKLDEAIRHYKKALFLEPRFAEAWVNLGNALGMKREYTNSLNAFNKAIAIDPKYGKALFGKAITLKNLGRVNEAIALADSILELYPDADVLSFKKKLSPSEMTKSDPSVDKALAIKMIDQNAKEILSANDLLDSKGAAVIVREIYQPEQFTKRIMSYCIRKYASLGKRKALSECIITSFYGSICADIFFHQDRAGIQETPVFDYLNDHIDIEFTDVNAERLLGTKSGDDLAESVWNIISPFITASMSVFDTFDKLPDEVILQAMKHAYIIGMLIAEKLQKGSTKKHSFGSRTEIDEALTRLADSSKDYTDPPPRSAMCYSIRVPEETDLSFRCDKCGAHSTLRIYVGENDIIDRYKSLAREFVSLGHKAEVLCVCDQCVTLYSRIIPRYGHNNIVFSFTANGATKPVYSFPSTYSYSDFGYRVALSFLKGSDTVEKLAEDTDSHLDASAYIKHVRDIIGKG